MPNPFHHLELNTDDPARAKAFYGEVFGWVLKDVAGGTYTMIDTGRPPQAGIQKNGPVAWLPYIEVDDLASTVERATAAGGTIVSAPKDLGVMGAFAIVADPTGARFGVWQGARK